MENCFQISGRNMIGSADTLNQDRILINQSLCSALTVKIEYDYHLPFIRGLSALVVRGAIQLAFFKPFMLSKYFNFMIKKKLSRDPVTGDQTSIKEAIMNCPFPA